MKSHNFALSLCDSNKRSMFICVICVPFSYLTQTSQNAQIFILKPKSMSICEIRACVPYISLTNN